MFLASDNYSGSSRVPSLCPYKISVMGSNQTVSSGSTVTIQFASITDNGTAPIGVGMSAIGVFYAYTAGFYAFCVKAGLTQATGVSNDISFLGKILPALPQPSVTPSLFQSQPQTNVSATGQHILPTAIIAAYLEVGDQFEVQISSPSSAVTLLPTLSDLKIVQLS